MKEAINAYHKITAASEFRELERLRSRARHDEAQALYHAQQQGIQQGMQQEREKWQAENEQLRKQIAELQAHKGKASE